MTADNRPFACWSWMSWPNGDLTLGMNKELVIVQLNSGRAYLRYEPTSGHDREIGVFDSVMAAKRFVHELEAGELELWIAQSEF